MATNVLQAEWIGDRIEVVEAANKTFLGVSGVLLDETKNMLTVETGKGVKRVPKQGIVFTINNQLVDGSRVVMAPEERIKIKVK